MHVRRDSTASLISSGCAGYEYDASIEGSTGDALTPSPQPRDASVTPCSTRSSSFDEESGSAEKQSGLQRTPLVNYVVPTWNVLAAPGPSSIDTGYAASAGGRTRASSEDSTTRSSETSLSNPGGAPSRDVTRSTSKAATYLGISKSSSEPDLRNLLRSMACPSARNFSRSSNRVQTCLLKPAASTAPSASTGHWGTSYSTLSAGISTSDEDGSVYNVTRRSRVSLADSSESLRHTSASDLSASEEIDTLSPRPSRSLSPRSSNPPESKPFNVSVLRPNGKSKVGPSMPGSKQGTISLDSRCTPPCLEFSRANVRQDLNVGQDSLQGNGSRGRRHSISLGSLLSSPATPLARQPVEGCDFKTNKSITEKTSLDERPPLSGSSLAESPSPSELSNQVRRSLLSLEAPSSVGADAFDNRKASFCTQTQRETPLIFPGVKDFTLGCLSVGVASTCSAGSLETERFSQACVSTVSSPASCHGCCSSDSGCASWESYSSCGAGSPHRRRHVSFALPVSATPWVCLADHDDPPSSVEKSSPPGCRVVCPSHQGQVVDKPPRLAQENSPPGNGLSRSIIGNEGGKGICADAAPSPLLKHDVIDIVSTPRKDLPSPDAVRLPVLEQDVTDIASTRREDLPWSAEQRRIERASRSVDVAAPPSTSEFQILDGDVLISRSDDPPDDPLAGDCSVIADPGNIGIKGTGILPSVAGLSDNVILSPRVRSREERGRGLRPASESSNQTRRGLLSLQAPSSLGVDASDNGPTALLTLPSRGTPLITLGTEKSTLEAHSAVAASTRSAENLETEKFSQACISAASSPTSCHRRRNSGRDVASCGSLSPRSRGDSPHRSPRVSFSLSVSATPWQCLANHDELPCLLGNSSSIGCRSIFASNGKATDLPSRIVQESTQPDDGRARPVTEPASATIGDEAEKFPCPDAAPSPRLKMHDTDMMSKPQDYMRLPGAVRSPALEQDITVVSTSRVGFSLPEKFRRIKEVRRSVELAAPPRKVQGIDSDLLTLRSADPPGDALTDNCSVVATPGNSGIEGACVLSSTSCSGTDVTDNVASSPWVCSREEGGRGLRFGDSPPLSQHGSSDSSWSLTKYVASGKANASRDDSDSSWSLTKSIASGEIVVSAGKVPDAESSTSSSLSYRMTLEHGPQTAFKDIAGSLGGSDACCTATPAAHTATSATEGRDDRIQPESPLPHNMNFGSSTGTGSARSGDSRQTGQTGRIEGVTSSFEPNMQDSTRDIIHATAHATTQNASTSPACARLHSGHPPSVRERGTTPHLESSNNIQHVSSKSDRSDVSIRRRGSPSPSARQKTPASCRRSKCEITTSSNGLPSTDEAGKKITSRGRLEREPSSSLRSSPHFSARTKSRGDKASKSGKHSGVVPPAVSSCGVTRPSSTARSKSTSTVRNRTPTLAAASLRPCQSHASSGTSSSTTFGGLRADGQRSGERSKSTSVLRASPANFDFAVHSSSQRSNRISAEAGTAPRPSEVEGSSRASRLASCASANEPRRGDITKSKSLPRRSSIEVKTTKTSRSRSLAIRDRLAAAATPSTYSRALGHRSPCPSASTSAVGKISDETNRLRKSTGQSCTVASSQRSVKKVSQNPVFLSSACASMVEYVAAVSPESVGTSISDRSGIDGGGRRRRGNNSSRSGGGSATASENPGERGAGTTSISSKPLRRRTATSDESKCQESSSAMTTHVIAAKASAAASGAQNVGL